MKRDDCDILLKNRQACAGRAINTQPTQLGPGPAERWPQPQPQQEGGRSGGANSQRTNGESRAARGVPQSASPIRYRVGHERRYAVRQRHDGAQYGYNGRTRTHLHIYTEIENAAGSLYGPVASAASASPPVLARGWTRRAPRGPSLAGLASGTGRSWSVPHGPAEACSPSAADDRSPPLSGPLSSTSSTRYTSGNLTSPRSPCADPAPQAPAKPPAAGTSAPPSSVRSVPACRASSTSSSSTCRAAGRAPTRASKLRTQRSAAASLRKQTTERVPLSSIEKNCSSGVPSSCSSTHTASSSGSKKSLEDRSAYSSSGTIVSKTDSGGDEP
eukprot:scaffold5056_cov94-Isochrysis_galbana.AAC.2